MKRVDVAVIGAGLGGLSAAACLSALGRSVLVCERQDGPGGAAHSFRRGAYVFDPAIHISGQGAPGQIIDVLLSVLGVRGELEIAVLEHVFGVSFPDVRVDLAAGFDHLPSSVEKAFPGSGKDAARFVDLCRTVTREAQSLPLRLDVGELDDAMKRMPTLFRWRSANLKAATDEIFADPRAAAAVTGLWPYLGLPPSALSLTDLAAIVNGLTEPGPAYVKGSFQKLADALETAAKRRGAEFRYGVAAERITVEGGRATGVVLADGTQVQAPLVIANAAPHHVLGHMIPAGSLPEAYQRRLERMEPSISAFVVYSATKRPIAQGELAGEVFAFRHWDHDRTWADVQQGRPGGMWLSLPTLVDPSLAPPGEHIVIISTLARYGLDWEASQKEFTETLLQEAERVLPGYRDGITFTETATPLTIERFLNTPQGAIYGWANSPRQTVPRRLAPRTPIEGLWLAGHWTHTGTSSVRVIYSGMLVAMMITGLPSPPALFEALARSS